jgi:UDP-N-acetylmuramoyl-tripeptide--D-alanyl-D-alanine ligase
MNLNTVAEALSQSCPVSLELTGVCTDSRLIKPGNLFVALSGDKFDGHAFVQAVEQQGAVAAIVQQRVDGVQMPQFVVEDTLIALAQIATAHRKDMHLPVIALTGSNGKTTVKEMIASILPSPSLATKGNLNNHIGAPLSVLALTPEHRYAVFELGANHLGEIAHTVAVVQPQVALINNIAPAHVEGFGSIEGVARAKGEIYKGLASDGIAVVNDDDAYAHFWDDLIGDRTIIRCSMDHVADVYAEEVHLDESGRAQYTLVVPNGRIDMHLQVPGLHNVRNSLAAAACCYAVGLGIKDIEQGLKNFTGVKGRMTLLTGINQCTIIDDTYNANLRSVLAGLEVLAGRSGDKIFVFGDMGELGEWAVPHHQEVGLAARRLGVNQLLTCGSYSHFTSEAFGDGGQHFENQDALVDFLVNKLSENTTVLVKGSRSSAMEKIVSKLLN